MWPCLLFQDTLNSWRLKSCNSHCNLITYQVHLSIGYTLSRTILTVHLYLFRWWKTMKKPRYYTVRTTQRTDTTLTTRTTPHHNPPTLHHILSTTRNLLATTRRSSPFTTMTIRSRPLTVPNSRPQLSMLVFPADSRLPDSTDTRLDGPKWSR